MELALLPLLVIAGLAIAWFVWQVEVKRRRAIEAMAASRGLLYSRHDHVGIPARHPFRLWTAGDERKWENVVSGEVGGRDLLLFEYQYTEVSHDHEGNRQTRTYKFHCAVAPLEGAFCPGLQLAPENLFSRLKDKVGFRDLELESDDFNRRFEVGCRDQRFAYAFLDARMQQWLLSLPEDLRFEVLGQHVLVAGPRVPPDDWMLRHHLATDFASRMPDVVRSLYPL